MGEGRAADCTEGGDVGHEGAARVCQEDAVHEGKIDWHFREGLSRLKPATFGNALLDQEPRCECDSKPGQAIEPL